MKTFTVKFHDELADRIDLDAWANHLSRSEWLRMASEQTLDSGRRDPVPPPMKPGPPVRAAEVAKRVTAPRPAKKAAAAPKGSLARSEVTPRLKGK